MTVRARWQPFQDVGEDDPRSPRDEMDLMHDMLARALGRDGGRQIVATGTTAAGTPRVEVARPAAARSTATPSASTVAPASDG